ncbi:MAG: L-histidine N(alpha)-methyltransferase [Gemmatimonadota bacterium]
MDDGTRAAAARRRERMRADVRDGFAAEPKRLPPKYFYDELGSRLFDEITRLPEYYLTRTERALLETRVPRWMTDPPARAFVELGSGYSDKSRVVLDAMARNGRGSRYVPVDVSAAALKEAARRLRAEYPQLEVEPLVADITADFRLPDDLPHPAWFAFLGSTIGNFETARAIQLLRRIRAAMQPEDRFLLGADLVKDVATLEAAYNDAHGVTAEFNRNVLRVLNRELGADFDPDAFEHRARFEPEASRIETHLVSTRNQTVTVPEVGTYRFSKGEAIQTEVSHKYDREGIAALCAAANLRIDDWATDADRMFALVLAAPVPAPAGK